VAELAKSTPGRTGERFGMKKASGKLGSKPSAVDSDSFVDELSESQHLQERLRAIAQELEATVRMLEQNLQEARSSAQSRRKAKRSKQ
jgi:transposase